MNELKLTFEEINAFPDTIGSQPFKQVYPLITKIQTPGYWPVERYTIRKSRGSKRKSKRVISLFYN
jgi:hypothetical protein